MRWRCLLLVTACGRVGFERVGFEPVDVGGASSDVSNGDAPGSTISDGSTPGSYVVDVAEDTYIVNNSGMTNENATNLAVGTTAANNPQAALIRFDLSSIPNTAIVTSASLRVVVVTTMGSGSINVELNRVTTGWSASTVTFASSPTYDATAITSNSVPLGTTSSHTFPVTTLAQNWINGTSANFGVILVAPAAPSSMIAQFASLENTTIASRPQLTILTQ